MSETVFYFKLYNGDDIIAEMVDETEDYIQITMPFRFLYGLSGQNQGVIATSITQWIPIDEAMVEPILIVKTDIVTAVKLKGKYVEQYEMMVNKKRVDLGLTEKKPNESISDLDQSDVHNRMRLLLANTPSSYVH